MTVWLSEVGLCHVFSQADLSTPLPLVGSPHPVREGCTALQEVGCQAGERSSLYLQRDDIKKTHCNKSINRLLTAFGDSKISLFIDTLLSGMN